MGEESTSPVYIGKYEDGKVVFEPLGEFKVIDHDITDVYPDDLVKPMEYVRTITRDQTITVRAFLCKKGLRGFYKAIGMPAYLRTEYLFPKKKKRGTARRLRRLRKGKGWMKSLVFYDYKAEEPIIDEFYIPPVDTTTAIPESEYKFVISKDTNSVESKRTPICKYVISEDELPAFAGPFEGEED